jgi:tetratricopeptide (TPR) repeat protein
VKLAVSMLLLWSLPAAAAPLEDATERARAHYEAGRALFSLGNYQEALREFTSGYQLAPKPRFLVNLGQTYRKLGQLEDAREMYRRFLQQVPHDDPDRPAVLTLLDEVDRELRLRPRQIVAPSPEPQTAAVVVVAPLKKPPFIRRHWWIIPTVLVVAAGVGVGVYFGVRSTQPDCSSAGLGCAYPDRSRP